MKRLALLLLVLLLEAPINARVPRESELSSRFQLKLEEGLPFIHATLTNHAAIPIELELPAGLRLNGRHEPCLPVVLGQSLLFKLQPRQSLSLSFQALSLYNFPHTEGEYEVALAMDHLELALSGKLQGLWDLHYRKQLPGDPFRVGQLVVYLYNGADPNQMKAIFTPQEIQTAQAILRAEPNGLP